MMSAKNKTILIVDDNLDVIETIKSTIDNIDNFKCITASSGDEAIDIIKNFIVDLIITDIAMPHGNGMEVIKKIKEYNINPKIIVVTGYVSIIEEDIHRNIVDMIIEKPYRPADLLHSIHKILLESSPTT